MLRFSPSTLSITSSRMPGLLPSSLASVSTGQTPCIRASLGSGRRKPRKQATKAQRPSSLTCQIMDRVVQEPLFQMAASDGCGDAFTEVESLDIAVPGSDRPLPA